jgi:hypothetical protein
MSLKLLNNQVKPGETRAICRLNVDDEMSDYYCALALSIFGPYWWAKPGLNLYQDLTAVQQAKFSQLVMSIATKNEYGCAATLSDLWQFIDIIYNEQYWRFMGKLRVTWGMLPRLLVMIGFVGLILYGLSLVLLLVL